MVYRGAERRSANTVTADGITVTTNDAALAPLNAAVGATSSNTVFISDSSTANSAANTQITTTINALSATALGLRLPTST